MPESLHTTRPVRNLPTGIDRFPASPPCWQHRPSVSHTDSASVVKHLRQGLERTRTRATIGGLCLVLTTAVITASAANVPHLTVVVASHNLRAGHVIGDDDLRLRQVPRDGVPTHVIIAVEHARGRRLLTAIAAGDVLSTERISSAPAIAADQVLISVDLDQRTAVTLAPGDRVDLWSVAEGPVSVGHGPAQQVVSGAAITDVALASDSGSSASATVAVPTDLAARVVAARATGGLVVTRRG